MATADYTDYSDADALILIIGRKILPDEHATIVKKRETDIRSTGEVLRGMGLIGSECPFDDRDEVK